MFTRTSAALALLLASLVGCKSQADDDADGVPNASDCGPDDPAVHRGAHEVCDGKDNDCDHNVDETFDLDQDGFLANEQDCVALGDPTDCNDTDPDVFPGQPELCNGVDDDCTGFVDDDADLDADGSFACADCDDEDEAIYPGATEICDGLDNDCTGAADETWDLDGDGFSTCDGDCNDRDPRQSPGIPELCDGADNDCDLVADEDFDLDEDGWRTCDGDCDDATATTNPGALELCNEIDDDCDGVVIDNDDIDGDGFTVCGGDCNEGEDGAFPGGTEACDDVDNDCDGRTDDLPQCYRCTVDGNYWYCQDQADWNGAEGVCEGFGGTLAIVADEAEWTTISTAARAINRNAQWWLGATDSAVEGTFEWVDGSPVSYAVWNTNEPSDRYGYENCLTFNARGWSDSGCGYTSYGFVCEIP